MRGREGQKRVHALIGEHLLQDLSPALAAAEDKTAEAVFCVVLQILHRSFETSAVAGKLLCGDGQNALRRQLLRELRREEGIKINGAAGCEAPRQLVIRAVELAQLAGERSALQEGVEREAKILHPRFGGAAEVAVVTEKHRRVAGNVVRGSGKFGINERHVAVGCRERHAVFQLFHVARKRRDQRLIRRFAALLARDDALEVAAQTLRAVRMQIRDALRHRQEHRLVQVFRPALGDGVKIPHCVQLVAEKLRAHRLVASGREHVEDAAAQRELPDALDEGRAAVARADKALGQRVQIVLRAGLERDQTAEKRLARDGAQAQRLHRGDERLDAAGRKTIEKAHTAVLPLARDACRFIERQLSGGQDGRLGAEKRGKLRLRAAGGHVILADDECGSARLCTQRRDQVAADDLADAGDGDGLPRVERL